MPPRKRRQHAGAINYLKRRDSAHREDQGARIEGELGSGEVRAAEAEGELGSRETRAESDVRSGETEAEGELGSGEVRAESDLRSGEMEAEGELGAELESDNAQDSNEDKEPMKKRVRLAEISAMADEPLKAWLDNLPRDDLPCYCIQHFLLHLVSRKQMQLLLLERFCRRMNAQSDVGLMTLFQTVDSSQTPNKVTTLETTR